jgi:nitrite reductase (NADH) small subunit
MNHWQLISSLEEIPRQGARILQLGEIPVAIFRTQTDEVFALRNVCPHRGGPLSEGIVHGRIVTCPLHNWQIDLASGQALEPDVGCTQTYAVKVEDGQVFLGLPG